MSILKNKSLVLVFTVILLILLPLLGILQYLWLGQISLSEHQRMKASLRMAAFRFSEEFNKQIVNISVCLPKSSDFEKISEQYLDCYGDLTIKGISKKLIKDIYFIKLDKDGQIYSIDKANFIEKRIEKINLPTELVNLYIRFENTSNITDEDIYRFKGIIDDIPAVIHPVMTPDFDEILGFTVATLNMHYLKYEFIPNLAKYCFGDGENLDYNLTFIDKNKPTEIIYQSLQQTYVLDKVFSGDVIVNVFGTHLDSRPKLPNADKQKPEAILRNNVATEYLTKGRWLLIINHPEGSLEEAVANVRQRNLAISISILLLLFISLIMFYISTHRAQTLAKQKVEFVTAMSHELRTPLAVIRSASENLSDGIITSPKDIKEYGEMINHEVNRLTDMVEQAIEFARIQKGWKPTKLHPIEVEDLINSVIKNLQHYIKENKVELEMTIQPSLPIIKGDWSALYRCIQNLISNAIKYSSQDPHISLAATFLPKEPFLQITVKDNGLGINKSDLSHIFDPFYRSQQVVLEQIPGSGLGLSLVKNVVEAHKGRITVESTVGKGSIFTLYLPVQVVSNIEEKVS